MEVEKCIEIAQQFGFTTIVPLDVKTLEPRQDVRDMCAVNTCGMYGTNWSCPPNCGTVPECTQKMQKYSKGVLLQTVGDIEDSLDWEGMMEVKAVHNKAFVTFFDELFKTEKEFLALADGPCIRCAKCTCPDSPCRFPEKSFSSMEAFGLYVSGVCKSNGVPYNYGEGKMCYTGCVLFD